MAATEARRNRGSDQRKRLVDLRRIELLTSPVRGASRRFHLQVFEQVISATSQRELP